MKKVYSLITKVGVFIGTNMVYYTSATKYLGVVNFILLLATFKLAYGIQVSAYLIVPAGFLLAMIVGFIDYKLIMKHQIAHSNKNNNILSEIRLLREEVRALKCDVDVDENRKLNK